MVASAEATRTFAGFWDSRAELMAHAVRYELKAAVYVAPKRNRRAA